jgi:hypothetical protein
VQASPSLRVLMHVTGAKTSDAVYVNTDCTD